MEEPQAKRRNGRTADHTNRITFTARMTAYKKRAFELRMEELRKEQGRKIGIGVVVEMLGDTDERITRFYPEAKEQLSREAKKANK